MRKSMDDELLRQQIIEILQNAGSSSTKEDLNMAVMNMLKILPPPVVKLKAEESMPTSTTLFKGEIPYPSPEEYDFTFIDLFAGIGGFRLAFQKAGTIKSQLKRLAFFFSLTGLTHKNRSAAINSQQLKIS